MECRRDADGARKCAAAKAESAPHPERGWPLHIQTLIVPVALNLSWQLELQRQRSPPKKQAAATQSKSTATRVLRFDQMITDREAH
jgi:hypothetical protein